MTRITRIIIYICFLLLAGTTSLFAQATDTIRYVKTTGTYTNNGRSWANAKSDLQGAINDLYEYLQENHLTSGSIYVAEGIYKPTETTEAEGGGLQFTAFKIYPGIHLYGGFKAGETDDNAQPYNADGSVNETYRPLIHTMESLESGQEAKAQPWNFERQTILSGTHLTEPTFTFDHERGTFTTLFPGNSYHVVWFATTGFIATDDPMEANHALPLSAPASVDGCHITGGYAASKTTTERLHTAYGAGAYLVENATLSRCIIDKCEATMRGGGVYLDGGGLVDRCYINTCQASGVGIMQGYGGGVCIDYDGAVTRSYIVNNSSRIGGGVAICHAPNDYPWQELDAWRVANGGAARGEINVYSPHATACIITNNTTTAEGGGIYFYDGGVGNHLTITRNKCVGQDITYYGRRHGRSGGAYILNGGQIYNSVLWGNKCEANNDIQYATYVGGSTEDTVDPVTGDVTHDGLNPKFYFSAVEKHDITDWAGTGKRSVMSLESQNTNPGSIDANYPYFIGSDGKGTMTDNAGAGYDILRPIYWKPAAISSMAKKGLQVTDALHLTSDWIRHAHTGTDLFNDIYEPMSTFGALVRRDEQFGVAFVTNQEKQIYREKGYTQAKVETYNGEVGGDAFLHVQLPDDGTEDLLPTIFVDPSRNAGAIGIKIGEKGIGESWNKPVGNINDAIHYFREHLIRTNDGGTTFVYDGVSPVWYDSNGDCWYHIPTAFDGEGNPTDYQDYKHVQVLVKAFERGSSITVNTAGKDAYLGTELRTSAIRPTSNMRIYGGYFPTSTGTNTQDRNARSYYSIISGNITNSGYENNSAHIVALINVRNVIIDGIKLVEGNANLNENHSYAPIDPVTGQRELITYGGGIIVNNASVPAEERIDMTGNILRNARIANCSAPDGAAVYVNSSNKKANGDYCKAELSILNTIIRNNTVGDGTHNVLQPGYGDAGIITARGGLSKIRIDHCDIVNNCGYAMETLRYSDRTASTDPADEGQIRIYNSVIYANGRIDRDNRKNIQQPLSYRSATGSATNITGNYVFLDWDAPKLAAAQHCSATLCRDMSEQYQKWAIRKMDINQQTILNGTTPEVYYFETEDAANDYITAHPSSGDWTWCKIQDPNDPSQQIEGPVLLDYPFFENPSKNVGHSTEGDKPMNGGVISYMPQNKNPMVNAAVNSSRDLWDSDGFKRNYGGDPDIGAIEDRTLPKAGTVLYVTPDGAGRRDGSSWGNAIQGNAIYALSGGAAGSDALDAQNGARITNTDPAIGSLPGNGVPTTDNRYSGGFATSYFTSYKEGGDATTTTTTTITTEINEYYRNNVRQDAETYIIQDHVSATNSTTETTGVTTEVSNQQHADPRFPYGEISGHSRTFWRANPFTGSYNGKTDSLEFINAVKENGWICNARTENYVSGLQYAVEKAAAYNALPENDEGRITGVDSVQVWVGNGKYTDYKGFVMRDKTTVMGGFPVSAYETPGEDERQALMSAVVNIPKAKRAKDFVPEDYETILQISDVNPEGEGHTFNEAAVNAWDNDLALTMPSSTTLTTKTINRNIVHRYDWSSDALEDVTSTYYLSSTFADNQITSEIPNTPNDKVEGTQNLYEYMRLDGLHTLTFGTATDTKDCWHLTYTGAASTSGSNGVIGRYEYNQMTGRDNNGKTIYENGVSVGTTTSNRLWIKNGTLSDVEVWQDMKNVPAGNYKIVVDLTAYYRTGTTVQSGRTPTGVTFTITPSGGTPIVTDINGYHKKPANLTQNLARAELSRYTFEFNQPSDGTLGIRISVGALDPSKGDNREVSMENFKLYKKVEGYSLTTTSDTSNETASETTHPEPTPVVSASTERTTLRKRVLTMPDVCVPTYGGGGIGNPVTHDKSFGDKVPHTDRVSGAVKDQRTATPSNKYPDDHYVGYTNVFWDGFTIRHGFLYDESMCHGGGAGVNMYEGAHLRNCIVINNYAAAQRMKGGGIFCDGATSTIEGCFVLNNTSMRGSTDNLTDYKQVFAGGMFLYEGTCFNSLFAKNYSFGSAGGVGFCVGRFFNNTIAYNVCDLDEGPKNSPTHKNGGAISIATMSNPNLFIANTIIYGNTGMAIRERYDQNININDVNPFINCYVQTEVAFTQNIYKKNINNYTTSGNYGIGNTLLNGVAPSASNTPFAADLDDEGNYTGNAGTWNDFRLTPNNDFCINTGTEDFTGSLKDVLKRKRNWSDAQVESQFIYRSVAAVELPINDVVYADRIQDCQIDIGAYEFDGTQEIKPGYELIAFDPERPDDRELCAVYYVNEGGGGLATGESYDNAACERKLQHILDAAGRLKKDLTTIKAGTTLTSANRYSTQNVNLTNPVTATYEEIYLDGGVKKVRVIPVPDNALADVKHVIVKLAEGKYYPIRSTNQKMVTGAAEEVLPTRSLMIPHGVEVMGGYTYDAEHPFYETYRDPLNHKTTFSGQVEDVRTGNYGRAYHVVTFTNDLFDTDNLVYDHNDLDGTNALAALTDRAVIDGISIEDGMANGTDESEKGGGAAIVTSFAHVRNCILQDNEATFYGGALYLEPAALVSGCVMLNNEAEYGGAVYVAETDFVKGLSDDARDPWYARLYNSTIVRNSASVRGGGVWYETNIRAKGICLWWNRSNDMNNVAGVFDTQKLLTEGNYPFAYSAVQDRRLPGVNNIELQADAVHGVRWTTNSIDDMRWRGDKPTYESQENKDAYYYIDRLSVLVRSGMPYQLYHSLRNTYPSLEYRDMAGVARMRELYNYNDEAGTIQYLKTMPMTPENNLEAKDNSFLEMGARVLNYHASPRYERPFTRLFVSNPQNVDTEVASRLLNSADPLYSQQGSSMANPFQKLSDAFDYIVALRTSDNWATHGTKFANAAAFAAAQSVGPLYTRSGTEGAYTYTEADSWVSGTTYFRKYKDIYCDTRFEVFISGGTYYPYHNTYGVEGHARSSTFVIPEGVTVVGGIDPKDFYCQDGYNFPYLQPMAGDDILDLAGSEHPELYHPSQATPIRDYRSNARTTFIDETNTPIAGLSDIELKSATPAQIWEARKFADINGNNVYEPWEFLHLTTLSGNTPRGTETLDNVYHVITCFADPKYVGELPRRYAGYTEDAADYSSTSETGGQVRFSKKLDAERGLSDNDEPEDATSEMHRTIILSGLNITQGNARDYDSEAVSNLKQYYRGGGIMVDGSWTDGLDDSGESNPDEKGKRNIPFYITASQFQNNNAIQGGAIFTNGTMNIFSCSFVQNLAQGPTKHPTQSAGDVSEAQKVVQYNGGGAIATNDVLRCVNTIFANNEAMLGDGVDMMPSTLPGYDKQGFGGAIWGGLNSEVRLMNCDIVMNKAVSYPSVFVNPAQVESGVEDRFCINTIYWGNKTTGVTNSAFSGCGITDINDDVFSYRSQENKEIELALEAKEADGTITDDERTQLAAFRENQPMFFCAYRPGFGPTPVTTTSKVAVRDADYPRIADFYHSMGRNLEDEYDPHEVPFLGEYGANYFDLFGGNNNINITFENEGVNGPNFVLPSTVPGKDGYNPSANWMPARINNLTDNGWSYLTLTSKTATGDIEYKQIPDPANPSAYNGETNTGGIPPETPGTLPDNDVFGGPFPFYAFQQSLYYKLTLMPFGNQHYMRYKNSNMTDAATNEEANMLRISSNPLTFEEAKAYIDLGVYEYQHRNLRINQSSEVDVLWVSAIENLDKGNDGYTWETPTSNLQAAIETLLKSRNDHAKQINIIGGEYKPTAVLGDNTDRSLSFTIQTRPYNNGAFTPLTNEDYGVRNLKFRGGYDLEIPEEAGYDFKKNKVTLSVEQRTSITQDQLNHVVNILDAEQYTTNVTELGAVSSTSRGVAIPITFEGITFNNTLADGIKDETDYKNPGGAAIYYHKQYRYDEQNGRKSTTDLLKPPAQCHAVTTTTTDPDTDETIEKVTWIWDWDTHNWDPTWTSTTPEPKLTLRNCTFTQNGKDVSDPTSAVLIEDGGGSSLIVNSVFDRNVGNPIDAVNTTVLNCTSGLNGGHIKLTETTENNVEYHSALYNNAIWRDDQNSGTITESTPGTQFEVPATAYNTATSTPSERMSYNAITGFSHEEDAQKNYGLSDTNRDLFLGPNFEDPENGDFSIKPGKKLMNQGVNSTYARFVWPQPEYAPATEYEQLMQNKHPDQSQLITRSTTIRVGNDEKVVTYRIRKATDDHDAGFNDRLKNALIDRGAYECTSSGQRVIYVDPNKTSGTETGRTWEEAYSHGHLQMAIDAATIYSSNGTGKAYVFVRGQRNSDTEDVVTFRDGVDVYGSIQPSSLIQAVPTNPNADADDELVYTDSELASFVNRVQAERRSVAARNVTSNMNYTTRIKGIASVDGTYNQGAVIDGFIISNDATDAAPATTPAVDITVPNVAVRNSIITDNVMSSGQPVVNLIGGSGTDKNSLLYNTLLYGNKAGTIVNVGANGYVLNCTVVADHDGETPIGGSGATTNNVSNTIAVNESAGMHPSFAPYRRPDANAYTPASYLTDHKPYWYQLHEQSSDINSGTDNMRTSAVNGGNAIAIKFPDVVDFSHDRDLLGNPRRLGGQVDNGCYETWRIDDGKDVYATNVTNAKAEEDLNKYVAEIASTDPAFSSTWMVAQGEYWTDNYGGHVYPHLGSVVYIGKGSKLSVDQAETTHAAPLTHPHAGGTLLFTNENPIRPGYLLVKEDGSLYGNGNFIQAEYVATERSFTAGEKQRLMAFPHDVKREATISTSYNNGTNTLTQTSQSATFTPYLYDADGRAVWNYDFRADNSALWQEDISPIQTANGIQQRTDPQVLRTEGWLLDFGTEGIANDATYRFTGWGILRSEDSTDPYDPYAYTEGGSTAKTVTLTQHDNHPNDGTAHFTKLENMGWNLKGSPWLVSEYATGGTNPDYNMHVPHVIYRSLGNTYALNTANDAYGQFYTEQSWDGSATLSPGDGFFTQTAAIGESEALRFRVPYYGNETEAPVKEMLTVCLFDDYGYGDQVAIETPAASDAVASSPSEALDMPYHINSDGIKWMGFDPAVPQLWLENAGGTPFSLAAHAPKEVPIPVGIQAQNDSELTISLRENLGAENYQAVWLIDQEAQRVVNLKEDSYHFQSPGYQTGQSAPRFYLQLDGQPPFMTEGTSNYGVYVRNRVLHVTGTNTGDRIRVYQPNGALLMTGTAEGNHWQTPLHKPGIYLVSIESETHKVLAQ